MPGTHTTALHTRVQYTEEIVLAHNWLGQIQIFSHTAILYIITLI